jgi:hypothetical protein
MSAFRITAPDHVTYVAFNFDPLRERRIVIPKPASIAGPVSRWEMIGDVSTTNASFATKDTMRIVSLAEPDGFGETEIKATIGAGKCVGWVFDTKTAL